MEQKYIDSFYSKIKKTPDCWEWQAATDKDGYGKYSISNGSSYRAHRLILQLNGIDITGKVVCHHCDNPKCCNPDHLFVGTPADNNNDKKNKGRAQAAPGSKNSQAKLNENIVIKIRKDPRHYKIIARELNLHPETVRMAKNGTTWKHIKEVHDAP